MTRLSSFAASSVAATLLIAATATHAAGQGTTFDKRTIFTFSGAVQVPGATLPAGTYVFRVANPTSPSVLTVLDAQERHVLGQFFFIPSRDRTIEEQNRANGRPVLVFYETPQGMPPAIRIFYYPTDIAGREFIYPKEQAEKFAAVAHYPILATDSDGAKGDRSPVLTIEPPTTTADSSGAVTTSVPVIAGQSELRDTRVEPEPADTAGTVSAQREASH